MSDLSRLVHQRGGQAQWHHQSRHAHCQPAELFVPAQVPHPDPQDLQGDESEPQNKDRRVKMQDERRGRRLARIAGEVQAETPEYRHPDRSNPDQVDLSVASR